MRAPGFVDFARIHVKAGDGGDGVVAFRREKYVPEGGPAGGHGGAGGSIFLEGNADLVTLLDLKMRPHIKAKRGENGENFNRAGRSGDDVVVPVPLGTTVSDADSGEEVGEVVRPGERLLVAQGGRGGRGNESFASSTHRTPLESEEGEPGQERNLILELKMIADVGIVGLPNAGKSTLLARLTNAHPKIAPYPFTTLHPNLGVMTDASMAKTVTLADIPGLIEGAHTGAGLGDRFLRHIERTKVLIHLVSPAEDASTFEDPLEIDILAEDLLHNYRLVRAELDQYSKALNKKPAIACLNKIDLLQPPAVARIVEEFRRHKVTLLPISAETGEGIEPLRKKTLARLEKLARDQIRKEKAAAESEAQAPSQPAGPRATRSKPSGTDPHR